MTRLERKLNAGFDHRPRSNPKPRTRHYGLAKDVYQAKLASQKGACSICGRQAPLMSDHDHLTGKLRDLLCRDCNLGLGHFHDQQNRLLAAVRYLKRHNQEPVL